MAKQLVFNIFEPSTKERSVPITDDKNKRAPKRKTVEQSFQLKQIMAVTSAFYISSEIKDSKETKQDKYAILYIKDFPQPVEVNESFISVKNKIFETQSPLDIFFLETGSKMLLNFTAVKTYNKATKQFIFTDSQVINNVLPTDIEQYEIKVEELRTKVQEAKKQTDELNKIFLDNVSRQLTKYQNDYARQITKAIKPLDDSLNFNGCLLFITDILLLIVSIVSIILICKL